VPENHDPNYWGEGTAMLMKVRLATMVPIEQITKYEVRLANG
jgi:hypothetical protein